jgi:hypothetical protein
MAVRVRLRHGDAPASHPRVILARRTIKYRDHGSEPGAAQTRSVGLALDLFRTHLAGMLRALREPGDWSDRQVGEFLRDLANEVQDPEGL